MPTQPPERKHSGINTLSLAPAQSYSQGFTRGPTPSTHNPSTQLQAQPKQDVQDARASYVSESHHTTHQTTGHTQETVTERHCRSCTTLSAQLRSQTAGPGRAGSVQQLATHRTLCGALPAGERQTASRNTLLLVRPCLCAGPKNKPSQRRPVHGTHIPSHEQTRQKARNDFCSSNARHPASVSQHARQMGVVPHHHNQYMQSQVSMQVLV
jgi:hypothetical protein